MRAPVRIVVALAAVTVAACSILTSFDGLSGGGDGGARDDAGSAPVDGASDASPEAALDAPQGADAQGCPGRAGPVMVNVGAYCIDATEVTREHYRAFLAADAAPPMPAYCAYRTTHVPEAAWPPAVRELPLPVTFVDWCDAFAYCAWAGKRLCGVIDGGAIQTIGDTSDSNVDAWYRACTRAGERVYPYGSTFDPTACNGLDAGNQGPVSVGSLTGCVGGYPGIFDMSGNVIEWTDDCQTMAGSSDTCNPRGGSFGLNDDYLRCASLGVVHRADRYPDLGFRCCAP